MLDIRKIRENPEEITRLLSKRGPAPDLSTLLKIDQERKETLNQVNDLKESEKQGF